MATWTYLVSDLRTGTVMAELPLVGVRMGKRLNDSGTLSATLPLSASLGVDAYQATRPARTAIEAWRDNTPWWGGVVWTSRYDSTNSKVELGAGDWWTYFDHRKVLPVLPANPTPSYIASSVSTLYTGQDQSEIARQLVALAQSHTGGNIGVVADAGNSGVLRDRTYLGSNLPSVGEMLKQLSQVDGGPDLMFDTTGPNAAGRAVRLLRIGTPTLGQGGSPHVFEVGGNVASFTWPSDGSRMATRSFAVGSGTETSQMIAVAEDTARYTDGWPLLEQDKAGYTSVVDPDTLQAHADADQYAARLPVITPTFTVHASTGTLHPVLPEIGGYAPGDDVRLVVPAGHEFFMSGLDARMRIVAIDAAIEDVGQETATVTVNPLVDIA